MISSFISSNSFDTLFIKTNWSWLTFESFKALEIKTSRLFNLNFDNDNILSYFLFFFLNYWFILLIPAVLTQIVNPIAELIIPVETPTKEAEAKTETHPVTVEI